MCSIACLMFYKLAFSVGSNFVNHLCYKDRDTDIKQQLCEIFSQDRIRR